MRKTTTTRETLTIYIDCCAPEELFAKEWEDLSPEIQQWYEKNKLPCHGTGDMGTYCKACKFSDIEQEY